MLTLQLILKCSLSLILSSSLSDRYPNFAHVAVIRKKDERQKLQGTTCKECEAVSVSDKSGKIIIKENEIKRTAHRRSLLPDSITRTSPTKRSRRSCLRAPGTDSSTCLPARRKTSGRSASRPRRRASTEVTPRRAASGSTDHPVTRCPRLSALSRLHQGGLEPAAAAAQKAATQRALLPEEKATRGAGGRERLLISTRERLRRKTRRFTIECNAKENKGSF